MSDTVSTDIDIEAHLEALAPIVLGTKLPPLDTSGADRLVRVLTRLAKSQMRAEQSIAMTIEETRLLLQEQASRMSSDLQEAELHIERVERFVIEILDLIMQLKRSVSGQGNADVESVADTLHTAAQKQMEKIGLHVIPALGEVPDSLYHFVFGIEEGSTPAERDRIVKVVRDGFVLNGRVLRKADVIVAK